MIFHLSVKDIQAGLYKFNDFHKRFSHFFITTTRDMIKQSYQYINGKFLEKGKGNMSTYPDNVPDCNNQSLHHFISNSPWKHQPVIDQIQDDVVDAIGDHTHGSLHVDECCLPKQGKDSVGVKRQYCGRLGKIANCQVGVFLGYVKGSYRTLIDERLYLPKEWIEDTERRKKCGVPDDVCFKKKTELAWEMIEDAIKKRIPFGWVGMDCLYGRSSWLRNKINGLKKIYCADIPCDQRVWLQKPTVGIPEKKGRRGPTPTKKQVLDGVSFRVEELKDRVAEDEWDRMFIRDTERCELWVDMLFLRVYPREDDGLPGKECWLIIRVDLVNGDVKYQLSNAPRDTSKNRLAEMSGGRFWIERMFEDGKGIAGLADYQVRSWIGRHHHMTMTMLAMLFLMELCMDLGKKAVLLTLQDVKKIMEYIMPKRRITPEYLVDIIYRRHKLRLSARRSHHRCHK